MPTNHDLLQSPAWEQLQRALGRQTWRVDGTLTIAMPLPLGLRYVYVPRGTISSHIETIVRESGAIFLRGEYRDEGERRHLVTPRVMRRAVEPEWTWRVSLASDEDAILAVMHEKHRYNVRLAERRGVRVVSHQRSASSNYFDTFWFLLQETAKRQGIATHPRGYYEAMFAIRGGQAPDIKCLLYLAEREGAPCAAAIVVYHGDTATYLHGGSSHAQRQHMAPHLLHWTAMRDAKAAGMRWYDFGGVSLEGDEQRWSGMTRFKKGFGGEVVHHPPMRDLIFRRGWYTMLAWMAKVW